VQRYKRGEVIRRKKENQEKQSLFRPKDMASLERERVQKRKKKQGFRWVGAKKAWVEWIRGGARGAWWGRGTRVPRGGSPRQEAQFRRLVEGTHNTIKADQDFCSETQASQSTEKSRGDGEKVRSKGLTSRGGIIRLWFAILIARVRKQSKKKEEGGRREVRLKLQEKPEERDVSFWIKQGSADLKSGWED